MGNAAAVQIHGLVRTQFDHMHRLKDTILKLRASGNKQDQELAEDLAKILADLSHEAKEINDIAYESASR